MRRHMESPLRQVVNENSAARLQNTYTLVDPVVAPFQIIASVQVIFLFAIAVILRQIKWRIGKDCIDRSVLDCSEEINTIGIVDRTESRAERRCQFSAV